MASSELTTFVYRQYLRSVITNMNLQQLEYIVALDEHKHFGRAAEHCSVSQPTLSTMVQKLEDELGVRLFERQRGAVVTTAVGRRVVDQAATVLRQANIMSEIVLDEAERLTGSIRIAMLPTIAPYLLPRMTDLIATMLPELQISFVEMMTSDCIEALEHGEIDVAIIASDDIEGMTTHVVYYEEFYGYVSAGLPLYASQNIRTSEVDPEQLWLLDEGHCFRDQLMRFCQLRRAIHPKVSYSKGSLTTFMHMVERGRGMTFIPELSLDMLNEEHRSLVRPFAIPRPCRAVRLCTRADYARQGLLTKLSEVVRSAVPERMHRLQAGQHLV